VQPHDLDDIQGNVLAGFNKRRQEFILLRFPDDAAAARAWLAALVPDVATTAEVKRFNDLFKANRGRGPAHVPVAGTWLNVAFTYSGLERLGASPDDLAALPDEFREGMRARHEQLGDLDGSHPDRWPEELRGDFDALLILAGDVDVSVDVLRTQMRLRWDEYGLTQVFRQPGQALAAPPPGRDHFDFRDGISQPRVALPGDEPVGDEIAAGEFVLGHAGEDPDAAPADDGAGRAWRNGSFVVFRRLRQEVPGFAAFVRDTAGTEEMEPDLLRAKLLGRHPHGDPLLGPPPAGGDLNSFDFAADPEGEHVPRAAHIRGTNPRDAASRQVRIIRRGIPYGSAGDATAAAGRYRFAAARAEAAGERGLVFVCYQRSIAGQFERLQQQANDPDWPHPGDGIDPIASQHSGGFLRIPGSRSGNVPLGHTWVLTTGGGYFLSPSLTKLRELSA
jgi:Dyp-type peroxidase family